MAWQPPDSDFEWTPPGADFGGMDFSGIGSGNYIEQQAARERIGEDQQDVALRASFRGLSSPLALGIDVANAGPNLLARGINAVRPGTVGYLPMGADYQRAALEQMGVNPEPSGTGEKAATAALGAVSGGAISSALGPAIARYAPELGAAVSNWALPPLRAAMGGAGAVTASDMAREAGASPALQIGAGALGGMLGGGTAGVLEAAGRGVSGTLKPLSEGGREEIAGRLLRRQADAPEVSIMRAETPKFTQEIVPGSRPTLAEVTQDPGLAMLQRSLPSNEIAKAAGVANLNNYRFTEIDSAIRKQLNRVNAVPGEGQRDVLEKLKELKQQTVQNFETAVASGGRDVRSIPVDITPITGKLAKLRADNYGNENITKLLDKIENQLGASAPAGAMQNSFRQIWNMRQSLDDAIYEGWKDSSKSTQKDLARIGENLRGDMNKALVDAEPSFGEFLTRYSKAQKGEDRIRLGRELLTKTENAGRNVAEGEALYGERKLSNAKFENVAKEAEAAAAKGKLSKGQARAFAAAVEEKRRSDVLSNGGGVIGSPTAPYLATGKMLTDDIIGGIIGDRKGPAGIPRALLENYLGRPLAFATRAQEPEIMRLVGQGLRDPAEGARLMQLGNIRNTPTLRGILENRLREGLIGEFYGRLGR